MAVISKDLGAVTAYAAAVNRGYTGTKEEFETLMASYATVAQQAAESAQSAEQSAQSASGSATDAQTAQGTAQQAATDAQAAQASAQESAQSAQQSAQSASQYAQSAESAKDTAVDAVDGFASGAQQALESVNSAGINWKSLAQAHALDSEAYALGTRDGEDVGTQDETYHNNAKYYAKSAATDATTASDAAQTATAKAGEAAQSASAAAESARTLTIDATLTQAGQAADSKAVGDEIGAYEYKPAVGSVENGFIKGHDGDFVPSSSYVASGYVELKNVLNGAKLRTFCALVSNAGIAFYNAKKEYLYGVNGNTAAQYGYKAGVADRAFEVPCSAKYVRVSLSAAAYTDLSSFNIRYLYFGNISTALFTKLMPYHGKIVSADEKNYIHDNMLYSAKSITFETNGNAYTGLSFDLYELTEGKCITVAAKRSFGNNFLIRIMFFDENNSALINKNTTDGKLSLVVPAGSFYCNITIAASWGTAMEVREIVFSDIRISWSEISGTGSDLYTGELINLSNNSDVKNRCAITLWKDFTNVSQYSLYLNEAMAIFNNYVFLFNGGGGGIVVNYTTKEILSSFETAPTSNNHQNSAQFTDIYFGSTDEFPLLLISRCGNTDGRSEGYDECLIYRVTRNNNAFSFTLVNSIAFSKRTYGTSWGVDNSKKVLYLSGNVNGNWQVTENNPLNFRAFDMPSRAKIISGEQIVLTEDDVLAYFEADFAVMQGVCAHNGLLFEAVQEKSVPTIYAIDMNKTRVVSKIPLISGYEPEGVAVYNERMYISQKSGRDTGGDNPLKIYEIEF